ncbi:histidine kinase [uncultured Dokdonia sp.]|mgnify:FL=1|uniref:sensor histidine kinase n=1 Tax=uncultured Dokdonia sp. TaxID=575653 RepID=UPI002617D1D3|nr:histidine kinase [uncultured Dokdonia sp.]
MDQTGTDNLSLVLGIGMIGMFILALSIIVFVLVYKRKIIEAQLIHQQRLVETGVAIQEEERKRFAADLHDEIGGGISTILLSMSSLEQEYENNQTESIKIKNIQKQLDNLLNSVREISYNITPYTLETYGLVATLSDICYQVQESGQLQIDFVCNGNEDRLPFSTELAIYRIVKELITNTIKHAEANLITLSVSYKQYSLNVDYTDDGKGYSEDTIARGSGIKNMINRAKIVGASLDIRGEIEKGTKATLILKR